MVAALTKAGLAACALAALIIGLSVGLVQRRSSSSSSTLPMMDSESSLSYTSSSSSYAYSFDVDCVDVDYYSSSAKSGKADGRRRRFLRRLGTASFEEEFILPVGWSVEDSNDEGEEEEIVEEDGEDGYYPNPNAPGAIDYYSSSTKSSKEGGGSEATGGVVGGSTKSAKAVSVATKSAKAVSVATKSAKAVTVVEVSTKSAKIEDGYVEEIIFEGSSVDVGSDDEVEAVINTKSSKGGYTYTGPEPVTGNGSAKSGKSVDVASYTKSSKGGELTGNGSAKSGKSGTSSTKTSKAVEVVEVSMEVQRASVHVYFYFVISALHHSL